MRGVVRFSDHIEFEMDGVRYCLTFRRSFVRGITKLSVHTRQGDTKNMIHRETELIDATPHILIRVCEVAFHELVHLEGWIKRKLE